MADRSGTAEITLPSDREIVITRRFDATAALVWEALTVPRHLLRWWGPEWCPLVSCEVDLRVGGSWRFVARAAQGDELAWHGTYRDLEPARRLVTTEVFEGYPEAESENTMTLDEDAGVTTLRTRVLHASREFRDGHLQSGMEKGLQGTFDRLDQLLVRFGSVAEQFARVAASFTARVVAVPDGAWDNPAPCEGWVARDVVRHLCEWVPAFLTRAGEEIPPGPSVDDDPVGAWRHLVEWLQAVLDDPERAGREFDAGPPGRQTVESALGTIVLGDVFLHTWDLARATGLDETLDPQMVSNMLAGMQPYDEALRQSGHYGPKVEVPDDADDQTKLIAFIGRRP